MTGAVWPARPYANQTGRKQGKQVRHAVKTNSDGSERAACQRPLEKTAGDRTASRRGGIRRRQTELMTDVPPPPPWRSARWRLGCRRAGSQWPGYREAGPPIIGYDSLSHWEHHCTSVRCRISSDHCNSESVPSIGPQSGIGECVTYIWMSWNRTLGACYRGSGNGWLKV